MNGPIDSSKLSSTETPESLHSCQLCPLIKLEAGVVSTITLPFNQVFLSARDGCRFLIERVYRIVPPSSWMFKDDPGPLLYLYLFGTKIASEISLEITTSLIDGCCIVDCDWRMSDAPWDDCIEDKLLAYTKRDSLTARYIKTRPPNQYPLSPENIRWMKHCLRRCHMGHAVCNKLRQEVQSLKLPKYMLDLRSNDNGQVRIIKTQVAQGRNMVYAILSYCWGRDPTILEGSKTNSGNIKHRFAGFPLSELPQTIQDAADVTRALGLRYLFVDALCIQQDQGGRIIQRNLDAMPEFYARAALVLSAACASHSEAGFLGPRDPLYRQYELPIALRDGENTVNDRIILIERAFEKKREPIDMRIWTQLEDKNALCMFRFETERVLWRCWETSIADSDVGKLSPSSKSMSTSSFDGSMFTSMLPQTQADVPELHLANWLEEVIDYSARRGESLNDKLVAFEWTAKHMALAMGWDSSQYKAGLWIKDMPRQLLWCRDCHFENDPGPGNSASKALAPTWSWASLQSPITWQDMNELDWNDYTLEVVECKVKLMSPSHPFKNVKGGQLAVRGYVREAFWNGREIVEGTSHNKADRTSHAFSRPGARNRTRSPLKTKAGVRYYGSRSPIGLDRQVYYRRHPDAELTVVPIEVVWDAPLPPAAQWVKCLEIRSGVKSVGHSYGIILSCDGRSMSKRLGFFKFQHRTRNVPGKRILEEMDPNWLHQKRRRYVCII